MMTCFNCGCKCRCTAAVEAAGIVAGVVAAFLQITGMITLTPVFLAVAFGIAVAFLGIQLLASVLGRTREDRDCLCSGLNTMLIGALGTILVSVVLLAVGITATSVISAILVGLLVLFFTLLVGGAACQIRAHSDCGS